MAIIGTLPNNIQNGNTVDVTPVMADFNFIVNQVNANANPAGTLTAPSGTRMIFNNPTAPAGWVIDATVTDHTVWVTAVGGGGVGGVNGYSTLFQNAWSSDGHALTTAELATHNHPVVDGGHFHPISDPQHQHSVSGNNVTGGGSIAFNGNTGPASTNTGLAATGITVSPAVTGITVGNNGSGSAHSHTKTFNSQFVQMVMAQKS